MTTSEKYEENGVGSASKKKRQEEQQQDSPDREESDILYRVDEIPPWYLCILLGFQQFLTAFGASFAYPVLIKGALCLDGDDIGLGELISTVIFVSGFSSIFQSTFGVRLPIIQSISYSFVTPVFVLMSLNSAKCPWHEDFANTTAIPEKGSSEHKAIWQGNLCELSGALMVGSCFSLLIGFSGIVGLLMRFIGPLTIAPTISLIALSLFKTAADKGSTQWWICFMTLALVALFSQYLRNIEIPCPCLKKNLKIFALFPVLFAVILSWVICVILTEAGALPDDANKWGYYARTDIRKTVLEESEWFRFPYPGQWGVPTVSVAGALGMMAAVLASTIESVGDYYACARLAGAPPPPGSAVSRGIGMEGITCILAGAWGAGGGNTSYSENIGAIGITKVGSRTVIQVAGLIMMVLGCLGKFGALFVTIPDPVVGGLFFAMFGMVGAVGISNLQFVDLNSSRNLFVFGVSLFFGLSVPIWVSNNPDQIDTGSDIADQIIQVLAGTTMFVGGALAFILDNTIPGTLEERGILQWIKHDEGEDGDLSVYDMPLIQPFLNRILCLRYVPFCPGFIMDRRKAKDSAENNDAATDVEAGQYNQGFQREPTDNYNTQL